MTRTEMAQADAQWQKERTRIMNELAGEYRACLRCEETTTTTLCASCEDELTYKADTRAEYPAFFKRTRLEPAAAEGAGSFSPSGFRISMPSGVRVA